MRSTVMARLACALGLLVVLGACGSIVGEESAQIPPPNGSDAEPGPESVPEPIEPSADGTCPADRKLCDELCVGKTDPAYGCGEGCGTCALPSATAGCNEGACIVRGCADGRRDCNGAPGDGCEVDVGVDARSCGDCNKACAPNEVCSRGACGTSCEHGLTQCGQSCVDVTSDAAHCGGCNKPCAATEVCQGSVCKCSPVCAGKKCGDPDGCGGLCEGTCASGQRCSNKQCVCDPQSCPNGCCAGKTCRPGMANDSCGTGGVACAACAAGKICHQKACTNGRVRCLSYPNVYSMSCDDACATSARTCVAGCFGKANVVARVYEDADSCSGPVISEVTDCATVNSSLDAFECCCKDQ